MSKNVWHVFDTQEEYFCFTLIECRIELLISEIQYNFKPGAGSPKAASQAWFWANLGKLFCNWIQEELSISSCCFPKLQKIQNKTRQQETKEK